MRSRPLLPALCAMGMLSLRPPAFAEDSPVATPPVRQPAAVMPDIALPASLTKLQPAPRVLLPDRGIAATTLLLDGKQPGPLLVSDQGAKKGMSRDAELALSIVGVGAGAGFVLGFINRRQEVKGMLIGAGLGVGVVAGLYLLALTGGPIGPGAPPLRADSPPDGTLPPTFHALPSRPEGLWVLGERVDRKMGNSPGSAFGKAALVLAAGLADGSAGADRGRGGGFPLVYVRRW